MTNKELEGFFIEDERTFQKEDIATLIGRLKRYAKLVGKQGRVHIEDKKLSLTDRSKLFLISRYLGGELSKLRPDLGIKKEIAEVTIEEFAEMLSVNEPNARARISQLIDEGFAKRPQRGTVQVEPFQIEKFLDSLEKNKEEIKKRTRIIKTKIKTKKFPSMIPIDEIAFFNNLEKFLSINKDKLKDIIHIRNNESFKFHHMVGKSKSAKQRNCVLCSGYVFLFGLDKKIYSSRELSDICYHSGIDRDGLNFTIREMKKNGLISKAGTHSQDNILRDKGKEEAKKIFQELSK